MPEIPATISYLGSKSLFYRSCLVEHARCPRGKICGTGSAARNQCANTPNPELMPPGLGHVLAEGGTLYWAWATSDLEAAALSGVAFEIHSLRQERTQEPPLPGVLRWM